MHHQELAPAKINLALHVLGRKDDGYHELDSIVAFADIADRLTFIEAEDWSLDISGPFASELAADADNLVLRAARDFATAFATQGRYRIILEKNLPVAAGIGGGSADAAATLRALAARSGVSDDQRLAGLALKLGADVPVCLSGGACRMRGSGERLDPWPGMAAMPAVLVNPREKLATAQVFAALALKPGDRAFTGLAEGADLAQCRNDLTAPALSVAPVIATVLAALSVEPDLRFARMSGSGATCFGIFSSREAARAAAGRISAAYPHWWVVPTVIG